MRSMPLLALLLSGCTVQVPSFPHPPTAELGEGVALGDPQLQPFTHGGVVVQPRVEPNRVLATFYAPSAVTVQVQEVTLTGMTDGPAHTPGDAPMDVVIDQPIRGGFASSRTRLIRLEGWGVDALGQASGGLRLTVALVVDGVPGVVSFALPLKPVRRIAWPT